MGTTRDKLTLDLERMLNQSCGHLLKQDKPKRKRPAKKPKPKATQPETQTLFD